MVKRFWLKVQDNADVFHIVDEQDSEDGFEDLSLDVWLSFSVICAQSPQSRPAPANQKPCRAELTNQRPLL